MFSMIVSFCDQPLPNYIAVCKLTGHLQQQNLPLAFVYLPLPPIPYYLTLTVLSFLIFSPFIVLKKLRLSVTSVLLVPRLLMGDYGIMNYGCQDN